MYTVKNLERLQRLHCYINSECTGSPKELSSRMHISERLVYNLIEQLKEFNAIINYSRRRKTYYYENEFQLEVNISISTICNGDKVTILT